MNRLRVRIHRSPALRVEVRGELCISSVPVVDACVTQIISQHRGAALILDLRAVRFCDVTALRCLWLIEAAARAQGVDVELRRSAAIARLERLVEGLVIARVA